MSFKQVAAGFRIVPDVFVRGRFNILLVVQLNPTQKINRYSEGT